MYRLYAALVVVALLSAGSYGAYRYYNWSQETIIQLRGNNMVINQANESLQSTIARLSQEIQRNQQLQRDLTVRLQSSQRHLNALRERFSQIDLTMEALQDPAGLEQRIDRAVERLIERIERETTAPQR